MFFPIFVIFLIPFSLAGMDAKQEKIFEKKFNKDFKDKSYCSYFFYNYMTKSFDNDQVTSNHIAKVIALAISKNKSSVYAQLLSCICLHDEDRFLETVMTNSSFVTKVFNHIQIQNRIKKQEEIKPLPRALQKNACTQTAPQHSKTKPKLSLGNIIAVADISPCTTEQSIDLRAAICHAKPWPFPKSADKNIVSMALHGSNRPIALPKSNNKRLLSWYR